MKLLITFILLMSFLFQGCGTTEEESGGDTPIDNPDVEEPIREDNTAPVASNITVNSDLTTPYVQVSLFATDIDNDTLTYKLQSPYNGTVGSGYNSAFIDSTTNNLYINLRSDFNNDKVILTYKVSDSIEYSNEATVTVNIQSSTVDNGLGYQEEDPGTYAATQLAYFDTSLFGTYENDNVSLPRSIDLSPSMPTPGNQGAQGSCVGWATAYALKSYQEKIEMGWSLNSASTIFSPAYIYNQLNGGVDQGLYIYDALQLIVDKGAATWEMMPYNDKDYLTQPTYKIDQHASIFKALEYRRVAGTDQIKASLANKNAVVIGMSCYSSFNYLSSSTDSSALYQPNTYTENDEGGHAVTIVGYDDNIYGGAFKIINSWGIDWGDNGYFWLPYNRVGDIVYSSYILIDKQNGDDSTYVDDVVEPIRDYLPNLEVYDWSVTYNATPGGEGSLTYEILNSGTGVAKKGSYVNLMISKDRTFDSSDTFVVYEDIPFDLIVGGSAYRDASNPRNFNFPQTLKAGTYYMAVWVDDLDEVKESNEKDNISVGDHSIYIQSTLSDISVESWWASWNSAGDGKLEYSICNYGETSTKNTAWDINLMLSKTSNPSDDSSAYYLFYEEAGMLLSPSDCIYRSEANYNRAPFNILEDSVRQIYIPSGVYYMSLWADDQDEEIESNEINNHSTGNDYITITNNRNLSDSTANSNSNGKKMIDQNIKKVIVTIDEEGKRNFRVVENDDKTETEVKYYEKDISARNKVIFPIIKKYNMPKIEHNDMK